MTTHKQEHTHTHIYTYTNTYNDKQQHTKLLSLRAWQTFRAVYPLQVRFTATSIHIPKEKHNNFPLFRSPSPSPSRSDILFAYHIVYAFWVQDCYVLICFNWRVPRILEKPTRFFFLFSFHSRAAVWDESVEGSPEHVNDTNTNKQTQTRRHAHTHTLRVALPQKTNF